MTEAWEERKKALENKYFHDLEKVLIEKIKTETREKLIHEYCLGRCPKCGDPIEAMEFINDKVKFSKNNEEFLISMNG